MADTKTEKERIRSLEDGIHMMTMQINDLKKLVCELSNQVWENEQKIITLQTKLGTEDSTKETPETSGFGFSITFESSCDDELPFFSEVNEYIKNAFEECLKINKGDIEYSSYGIGTPDENGVRFIDYYFKIPEISPKQAKEIQRYCLRNRLILPIDPRTCNFHTLPPGGLSKHPEYGYCGEN